MVSGQPAQERPPRVIAWPAFRNHRDNPYNSLLYRHLADLGVAVTECSIDRLVRERYDVWHLHWPEAILNRPWWQSRLLVDTFGGLLRLARRRGTKIVWTAHNLRAHERLHPRLEARLWQDLIAHLDGYIALSEGGRRAVLAAHPALAGCPGFVIPHGHYRDAYPDTVSRAEARRALALPHAARTFLWLGQIRPYKNLPGLIDAFRRLPGSELRLVIAGRPASRDLGRQVRALAADDRRIRLHLDFVPPTEVQVYLRAADLVVLPYREILNSGSAILALSFARPLLVPARGALAELPREVGPGWVRTYHGELGPAHLAAALDWALAAPRDPSPLLQRLSWERIARQTLAAYQAVGVRAAVDGRATATA